VPVFIGDDETDEDGVKAALKYGGFGVRVGEGESGARHRLPDVKAVFDYIATAG
jgi:trehalose 6-phosphate phosphatase